MSFSLKTTLTLIFSLTAFNALASPFSWEAAVNYADRNIQNSSSDDEEIRFSGRYYFAPVKTDKGPLQEAAFIQRSDSIGLSYSEAQLEIGNQTVSDADSYSVSGNYVHNDTGWLIEGSYSDLKSSSAVFPVNRTSSEGNSYRVAFGKYLFDTTKLSLSYLESDTDQATGFGGECLSAVFCFAPFTSTFKLEDETYSIDLKHLGQIGNYYYLLRAGYSEINRKISLPLSFLGTDPNPLPDFDAFLEGGLPDFITSDEPLFVGFADLSPLSVEEDFSSYDIGVTFYPVNNLSISVDYSALDNDTTDPETYQLSLEWFIVPEISVGASYTETHFENVTVPVFGPLFPGAMPATDISPENSENYSVGIKVRF